MRLGTCTIHTEKTLQNGGIRPSTQAAWTAYWIACRGDYQTVRRDVPKRHGIFQNIVFPFNLCVLFFQIATKLLGQVIIKMSGYDYLIKWIVSYFFGLEAP
jgi:hypothetical protein